LFLIINKAHSSNIRNILLLRKKTEIKKERLAKKSKLGITMAGITSKLDNIYVILLKFSQGNILRNQL